MARPKRIGHIHKGGKSYMVQRSFKAAGIPRMHRSSGTSDIRVFQLIDAMLTSLAEQAKGLDGEPAKTLLHKLNNGDVSFIDALTVFQKKGSTGIVRYSEANGELSHDAFVRWLITHPLSAESRKTYLANFKTMTKHASKDDVALSAIPTVLKRYREWCVMNTKNFRAFNYTITIMQSWVKSVVGDESEIYRLIGKIEPLKIKSHSRDNEYFSPSDMRFFLSHMPDDYANEFWFMALHTLGPKEFLNDGIEREGEFGLRIHGGKTDHRERVVPFMLEIPDDIPAWNYDAVQKVFKRASNLSGMDVEPYDLRRCTPRWMTEAGIPWPRIQIFMGHAPVDMSSRYAYSSVQQHLQADGMKLRAWIDEQLKANPPKQAEKKIVVRRHKKK